MRVPATLKKDRDTPRKPWVFYLPRSLQVGSELLFLALLCVISGIAALLGLAEPSRITEHMSLPWYNAWGAMLSIGGILLSWSIFSRDYLLEKFGARVMSIMFLTYAAWSGFAAGTNAVITIILCLVCVFLLEKRISIINIRLNPVKYVRNLPERLKRDGN